jgi:hypothetical protein
MPSRRTFLQAGVAAAFAGALPAKTLKAIGVQLYTVRGVLPEKPAETLRAIDAIGYQRSRERRGCSTRSCPLCRARS